MYQAIITKYVGPTNHKGARVIARTGSGVKITVSWDHALDVPENHLAAARALAEKLNWDGVWVGGGTADGYAFVSTRGHEFIKGSFTVGG